MMDWMKWHHVIGNDHHYGSNELMFYKAKMILSQLESWGVKKWKRILY